LRTLLDGIVDYAGLFPPASLDLPTAVRNYASYLEDHDAWMLGRFVIPAARLAELDAVPSGLSAAPKRAWRLAALVGADIEQDIERSRAFNAAHRARAAVDVLEVKAASAESIQRVGAAAGRDFTTFVELPTAADLDPLLDAVKHCGYGAK